MKSTYAMNYGSHYIVKRTELVQPRRKVSAQYDNSLRAYLRGISKMGLFAVHSADTRNSNGLKQEKGNGCK